MVQKHHSKQKPLFSQRLSSVMREMRLGTMPQGRNLSGYVQMRKMCCYATITCKAMGLMRSSTVLRQYAIFRLIELR